MDIIMNYINLFKTSEIDNRYTREELLKADSLARKSDNHPRFIIDYETKYKQLDIDTPIGKDGTRPKYVPLHFRGGEIVTLLHFPPDTVPHLIKRNETAIGYAAL
jgi:hypothetical protein